MNKDQCCNHDCNQGRNCPVREGTHKPAEAVHQIQEPTVNQQLTIEREAFEKWLGIKPCGAAHDFGWAAWQARAALAATQAQDVNWDAELGLTAMRFVDRAGDVHPGIDDAETICADFYAAMISVIDRMPHVQRMKTDAAMRKSAAAPVLPEPFAYVEHHKAGDNLWFDCPGGKYSGLYTEQQVRALLATGGQAQAQAHAVEQEPFGYFKAEPFGWTDCGPDDEGAVALYEKPQVLAIGGQAQAEKVGEQWS